MSLLFRLTGSLLLSALLLPIGPTPLRAQSVTVQNGASMTIEAELDVPGNLSESGSGSTLTFNTAALTLNGSSQQSVGIGPTSVTDLTLDNSNAAVLNSAFDASGTLTLTSGPLTTNGNLTLTSSSETSVATISGSGSGSVSGDVTFERHLAKGDGASHFRMLGVPTATTLDNEGGTNPSHALLSNMWTQATGSGTDATVSEGNVSVYDFNEGADLNDSSPDLSNGWTDIQNLDNNVSPGEGVLAYLFADRNPGDQTTEGFPGTLTATGSVQAEENSGSAINPTITFTGADGDGISNNGRNLIANPFMAPIDWESIENDGTDRTNVEATIYVYDAANGTYATYMADESGTSGSTGGSGTQGRYIAPFQAFFVKADGSSSSIGGIDAGDKATGQSLEVKSLTSGKPPPQVTVHLRAEGDSTGETTVFRFTENAVRGKDAYDAYQLQPLDSEYALVASEMGAAELLFDIQSRPVPAEEDTIDLALGLTKGGSYVLEASTLAELPSEWNVILKNMDSGARYDLGAGEMVAFEQVASKSAAKQSSSALAMLQAGQPTVAKASGAGDLPELRLFVGPEAALPVEMAGFEAEADGQAAVLTWQTASETNNAGFAVQRQVEGTSGWTKVGLVESKAGGGTTSEPKRYRFTDESLPFEAEQLTYRLCQKDLDRSTSRSKELTVRLGAPSKATLHAPFPNPARRQVTLRYETPTATDLRVGLYDVLGRPVRTVLDQKVPSGRHETRVQTSGLPAGTYFLRMRAHGHTRTRRLTVVR